MKIRVAPLLTTLVLVAALSGCAGDLGSDAPVAEGEDTLRVYTVELPNGEAVDCIGSRFSSSLVIPDCDWANIQAAGSVTPDESGSLRSYTVKDGEGREIVCVGSEFKSSVVVPDCNWSTDSDR